MAKRPALTVDSFLSHVFSPKKNALPTGLRARPIKATKGRRVARVNQYNKMDAVKQEVLKRSGLRDAFLKGETTYVEAKRALRGSAVERGIVKPVRTRAPKGMTKRLAKYYGYNAAMVRAFSSELRKADKHFRVATIVAGTAYLDPKDAPDITYAKIKEKASDPNEMIADVSGYEFNPYWYR